MDKSPDAFRTISEVAEWLGVQTHVLRFWESKFAQVKPVKRAGGRRYYRPADMTLLGGIKTLLHDDGMTIKGVQKLLREEGISHVSSFSQPLDNAGETETVGSMIEAEPETTSKNVLTFKARSGDQSPTPATDQGADAPTATSDTTAADVGTEAVEKQPDEAPEDDGILADTPPVASDEMPGEDVAEETLAKNQETSPLPSFLTQPMGGATPSEPPRARQVDAPDPPPEDQIATKPGMLSRLAGAPSVDADRARAIAPLLSRLAVLRDGMVDQRN